MVNVSQVRVTNTHWQEALIERNRWCGTDGLLQCKGWSSRGATKTALEEIVLGSSTEVWEKYFRKFCHEELSLYTVVHRVQGHRAEVKASWPIRGKVSDCWVLRTVNNRCHGVRGRRCRSGLAGVIASLSESATLSRKSLTVGAHSEEVVSVGWPSMLCGIKYSVLICADS